MAKNLVVDSWIREAHEAATLVEDIETRVRLNKNSENSLEQLKLISDDIGRSKLLEVGVKLDRLEALLHNPPSRLILTNEDLEYRWKMLLDIQLRTKSLALCLYALPSPSPNRNSSGGSHVQDAKQNSRNSCSYGRDQIMAPSVKIESDLLNPLVLSDDATQSHMQVCWIICVILGAAAFVFVLVILCAAL